MHEPAQQQQNRKGRHQQSPGRTLLSTRGDPCKVSIISQINWFSINNFQLLFRIITLFFQPLVSLRLTHSSLFFTWLVFNTFALTLDWCLILICTSVPDKKQLLFKSEWKLYSPKEGGVSFSNPIFGFLWRIIGRNCSFAKDPRED